MDFCGCTSETGTKVMRETKVRVSVITIYIEWEINTYPMSFDLGNRTVVEVPSKYNVLIKYPVDVEWVRYMPVKWVNSISHIEVRKITTISAVYRKNVYIITLVHNGSILKRSPLGSPTMRATQSSQGFKVEYTFDG